MEITTKNISTDKCYMIFFLFIFKIQRETANRESENITLNIDIITEMPTTITHPIKCLNKN